MSTELLEGLGFDLTDTLTCHSELSTDLFKGMHISSIETKSHDDDFFLTGSEKVEHLIEIFLQDREIGRLLWREVLIILDEVSERRIFFTTDWRVEGEDILRDSHDLTHLTDVHIELECELLHEWFTGELLRESAVRVIKFIDRLDHMDRHTDRACLIRDRTSDSLTDPPRSVGREFESSIWVELIDGAEESDISFLYEVEKSETTAHILLRDGDDETEIGLSETLAGFLISLLDESSETDFFFCIDEGESPDLIEIHTDRVIRYF
jgi:hypothetical protein